MSRTNLFYSGLMLSGLLLREARRRAGLTQAELGARIGRPQTQIARWERGAVLPSLETLRELVRACGLELTLALAAGDDSYARDARERLALAPPARFARSLRAANAVRALGAERGQPAFDPLPVLAALERARVDFVLVGSLAAVLRGSPLVPLDATIMIVPAGREDGLGRIDEALAQLGATRAGAEGRWRVPELGAELAAVPHPPGTSGWLDLRRDATPVLVSRAVRPLVSSLADLVRIAEASPDPEEHARVVALRTTLELARTSDLAASA
jgi:transcriptional regulator with XRE-family HTH domain